MDLGDIIGAIESGGNPRALKFERATFEANHAPVWGAFAAVSSTIKRANGCDDTTAEMIYSTSWGIFQFMGFVLYVDHGWTKSIFDFVDNPVLQREMFATHVHRLNIAFDPSELAGTSADAISKRQLFALKYNGPGNVDAYAQKIAAEIERQSQGC